MENLLNEMRQAHQNQELNILTLEAAKQLKGKRIQIIYFGYKGQDGVADFIVGEIKSEFELAELEVNEQLFPEHGNRAKYWESFMSEEKLNQRKQTLCLLTSDGKDLYIKCHLYDLDGNTFTCSDADRYVFYREV